MIKQRNACWQTTIKTHRHTRSTLANSLHVTIKQWKICDKTEKHLLVFENRVGGTSTFIYHSFVVARLQVLSAFVGGGGGWWRKPSTIIYHNFVGARLQVLSALVGLGGGGGWRKPSAVIYHDFVVARLQVLSAFVGGGGGGGVMEKTQHYYLPQFCRSQTPGTFCTCWFGGGGGMEKTQHCYLPQFCSSQTPGTFCTCWSPRRKRSTWTTSPIPLRSALFSTHTKTQQELWQYCSHSHLRFTFQES